MQLARPRSVLVQRLHSPAPSTALQQVHMPFLIAFCLVPYRLAAFGAFTERYGLANAHVQQTRQAHKSSDGWHLSEVRLF